VKRGSARTGARLVEYLSITCLLACLAALMGGGPALAGTPGVLTASGLALQPSAFADQAVPDVTGISPSQALAGDLDFTITVTGSGFVQGSTVLWNGETRDTGFVSSTAITATIRAADVAVAGTAFVTVSNPGASGGVSPTARVFSILNPAPFLETLDPSSVWTSGPGFTLAVNGSSFTRTSVIQVAGMDMTTQYVSSKVLTAQVPAEVLSHAASISVRVFTPSPGGGLSGSLFLKVTDDDVPPVTKISGFEALWNRKPVTLTFTASDVGSGVQTTYFRIGRSGMYQNGTSLKISAPADHSNDGMHVVEYFSVDRYLNVEEPAKEIQVGIDTRPPTTSVDTASVATGGLLTPKYYVYDQLSPRARDALLQVSDKRGKVLLKVPLGKPTTRAWHTGIGLPVTLPKGVYKMRLLAHDLAGNAQSSTKSAALTVS
jgi:hypothetical protein